MFRISNRSDPIRGNSFGIVPTEGLRDFDAVSAVLNLVPEELDPAVRESRRRRLSAIPVVLPVIGPSRSNSDTSSRERSPDN